MARRRICGPITELQTVDLDTVTTTGTYLQPGNAFAKESPNHPCGMAGMLEVTASNVFVFQRYTAYESNGIYVRSYAPWKKWEPWKRIVTA